MASNCDGVEPIGSVQRWSKAEGTVIDVSQPHLISKYINNVGGVNRMDQNIGAYRISILSWKWWWPLFAYLLDVAMQKARLIYRLMEAMNHQPMDHLEFRRSVCNVHYKNIHSNARLSGDQWGARSLWISVHQWKYAWMATTTLRR
jgi:hypothetical protein